VFGSLQQYKCSAVAEIDDRLTTIDMGLKEGAAVPLLRGAESPSNDLTLHLMI